MTFYKEFQLGKGKGNRQDNSSDEKSGQVATLKRRVHHLEKEIKQLKSELRTYEKALSKNVTFLREKTRGLSLEDLIAGANAELNLQEIKDQKVDKFEDMKKKWACDQCSVGILKFISIPKGEETYYFRRCSNPKCHHRTEAKLLTETVDKGI